MNIFGSVQVRDVINLICFFGVPESGQQLLDRSLPAQIGSTSGFEEFRERESVEQKWDHTNLLYILSYWIQYTWIVYRHGSDYIPLAHYKRTHKDPETCRQMFARPLSPSYSNLPIYPPPFEISFYRSIALTSYLIFTQLYWIIVSF